MSILLSSFGRDCSCWSPWALTYVDKKFYYFHIVCPCLIDWKFNGFSTREHFSPPDPYLKSVATSGGAKHLPVMLRSVFPNTKSIMNNIARTKYQRERTNNFNEVGQLVYYSNNRVTRITNWSEDPTREIAHNIPKREQTILTRFRNLPTSSGQKGENLIQTIELKGLQIDLKIQLEKLRTRS